MSKQQNALRLALEALEYYDKPRDEYSAKTARAQDVKAMNALRETLAENPPQRKPLTGEKINARAKAEGANNADFWAGVRFAEAEHCIKE